MDDRINNLISANALSIDLCYEHVHAIEAGGNCLFVGTVRNKNKGKEVVRLEFESYEAMAIKEIDKIAEAAVEKFDLQKIAIHHRIGNLKLGDIAVIIATSSKHRKNAFLSCEFAIDELKKTVPIWKKEFLNDGSYWVNSTP